MDVRVRMTAAQQSAFEIYVSDPAVTDADAADTEGEATARDYREIAACRKGGILVVPDAKRETAWRVLSDASNSADAERTADGNRAARSLNALHASLEAAFKAGNKSEATMTTVRELLEGGTDLNREWIEFEADALEAFLKVARNAIADEVGKSKYETLLVKRSRSTCWLEFRGVDSSDMPLDWTCSMTPTKGNEVLLFSNAGGASPRGRRDQERKLPLYQATPGQVVEMFRQAYGI